MKRIFTGLFTVCLFGLSMGQSAWVKNKGELYSQFTFSGIFNYSSVYLDGDREYKIQREITDITLQLYGEYGLTDDLTLVTVLPFKSVSAGDAVNDPYLVSIDEGDLSGLSNVEIGLRKQLLNKKIRLAGQLNFLANSADYDAATGLRTGYDASAIKPSIAAGYSSGKYFLQTFVVYEHYLNDYSSNLKLYMEAGYKFFNSLYVIAYLDLHNSMNNGDVLLPAENAETALYVNNQEFNGMGLKFIYEWSESMGLTFNLGGAAGASYVAKAPAMSAGLYRKF